MKKFLICVLMAASTFKASAVNVTYTYDCSNPNLVPQPTNAAPPYPNSNTCGYTDAYVSGDGICYNYQHDPGAFTGSGSGGNTETIVIINCNYQAPINSNLMFLIFAGLGAGAFMFYRQAKLKVG